MVDERNETEVSYKAIADFDSVQKALRAYRRELEKTKAAEKAFNEKAKDTESSRAAASARRVAAAIQEERRASDQAADAQKRHADATQDNVAAIRQEVLETQRATKAKVKFTESTDQAAASTDRAAAATNRWSNALSKTREHFRNFFADTERLRAAQDALSRAQRRQEDDAGRVRIAELRLAEVIKKSGENSNQAIMAAERLARARRQLEVSTHSVTAALRRYETEMTSTARIQSSLQSGTNRLYRGFQRFGNWRPRLTPPFVALVPIIGAVAAALNPLIAMMGSVGAAALGLASNIGSLAGAFLALPGILSGVVAGLASVIASFGGVGSVFKAYGAMQKATNSAGGGSTGPTQAERAEDLAQAEWNLAKAQRNVQKAQENLNKARQEALQDLIDLREEVSRASLNEERAVANLRLAQEEYWNVMADPGSTLGDKLDAAAAIKEAEADLQDVRKRNTENAKKLADAEKKGINQSEKVLDAQENLTDAVWAERDAQRALQQEVRGTTSANTAAVTATNEFNDALAKLSPSARAFALAIIGMKDEWEAFQRTIQEDFFSQFVNDLYLLPAALNNVAAFLRPAAREMGRFASEALRLFTSPEWSRDMATIGEQNGTVLRLMGEGALSLATALKDIVIAAGPFTEWLVGGLAQGADNLERIVATAREDGSLAEWLDKVAGRLEKWWEIVKNVGATIFNYSAAASEFGDWITDGLLNMTEGWRENSEAAREEGSGFQEYLDNIRPLLTEISGMFGDFFGWLREEMMDPENIEGATRMVKLLREEFGPAVANFLDTMSELEIDEKFITAITKIIEAVTSIMELGGGAMFETFFDVIVGFFEALAEFFASLPPGSAETLGRIIGALAAAAFIGKFTGITSFIGTLTTFLGSAAFAKFGTFVANLLKLDKLKASTGRLVAGAAGAGAAAAGGAAAGAAAGGAAKGGKLGRIVGGLAKGGIIGAILSTIGVLVGDAIAGSAPEGSAGTAQRVGGNMLSGASNGAGWGAMIGGILGSIIPGAGTAAGAAVGGAAGGVIGGAVGLFGTSEEDKKIILDGLKVIWGKFTSSLSLVWEVKVVTPLKLFAANVSTLWNNEVVTPFKNAAITVGSWWASHVVIPFQGIAAVIGSRWQNNVVAPFQTAAINVMSWWNTSVVPAFKTTAAVIGSWWNNNVVTPFRNAATNVQNWWNNSVVGPFKSAAANVQNWWNNSVVSPFRSAASNVQNWWNNNVINPFKGVIGGIKSSWEGFWNQFRGFNMEDSMSRGMNRAVNGAFDRAIRDGRIGDVPGNHRGGSTLKRVQSALKGDRRLSITSTYRTPAQNRAAGGSATSLHMDEKNPAVDIAGPISAMNAMAKKLADIGGWRQLYYNNIRYPGVGYWPGHSDHIHVANKGGMVPGVGNGDIVPHMLTPGEFVIRKEIVNRVGPENIARLNSGVLTFSEMLRRAQQGPTPAISGGQDVGALLSGTGLGGLRSLEATPSVPINRAGGSMTVDNSVNIEKLEVNNPVPETTSDSLPNAIRRAGYLNRARTT